MKLRNIFDVFSNSLEKSTPRHLDGEMFNPKDISISIAPNLTYKRQGKHEHNHSALFPCLSYTQFREVKIRDIF